MAAIGFVPAVASAASGAPAAATESSRASKAEEAATARKNVAARKAAAKRSAEFESKKLPTAMFEEGKDKGAAKSKKEPASGGAIWRMLLGLLFVLGVIYAVHWLLKNYSKSRFPGIASSGGGAIDVIATQPLAANRTLHLVRVGGEVVLIGATETNITQLGTVDTKTMLDLAGNAGNSDFQQALNGALSGSGAGGNATGNGSFMSRFIANLQLMTAR